MASTKIVLFLLAIVTLSASGEFFSFSSSLIFTASLITLFQFPHLFFMPKLSFPFCRWNTHEKEIFFDNYFMIN